MDTTKQAQIQFFTMSYTLIWRGVTCTHMGVTETLSQEKFTAPLQTSLAAPLLL